MNQRHGRPAQGLRQDSNPSTTGTPNGQSSDLPFPPLAAGAVPVLRSADRAANGLRYAYADASRRASPVTHGPDLKETRAPK
jgi:hypothetical protein